LLREHEEEAPETNKRSRLARKDVKGKITWLSLIKTVIVDRGGLVVASHPQLTGV
jgi:hypothetical protein